MSKLMFIKVAPSVEKQMQLKVSLNMSTIAIFMIVIVLLVAAAVVLYGIGQSEAGRIVLDVVVALVFFSVGRTTGEKQGVIDESGE